MAKSSKSRTATRCNELDIMASVVSEAPQKSNRSFAERLLDVWRAKRRRNRIRQRSMVRFRLTREGVHFVGVLLFIFFGAVIRDINLLILLAGAMIGLLVLQWRFNVRTLVGVKAYRQVMPATTVDNPTQVLVQLTNPKRWLGSWLVLVEDPLKRLEPVLERASGTGSLIVDEVRPRGKSEGRYELTFHHRGRYEIGPTSISTRFPIGLGRGWRTLDNATHIIVRPRLGKILPLCRKLFQLEQHGNSLASSKAGANEADFYGLRPWATGDSKRWIHWRTTARLGELSVRQFERQQHQNQCVLLDLYEDTSVSPEQLQESIETAIAFLATIANDLVLHRRGKLSVAVAGNRSPVLPSVQSPILVDNLLDELATIMPARNADMESALQGLSLPLAVNPQLLVISTRPNHLPEIVGRQEDSFLSRLVSRVQVTWLNASAGELEPYFEWTSKE